jgi:hypothetical protein
MPPDQCTYRSVAKDNAIPEQTANQNPEMMESDQPEADSLMIRYPSRPTLLIPSLNPSVSDI